MTCTASSWQQRIRKIALDSLCFGWAILTAKAQALLPDKQVEIAKNEDVINFLLSGLGIIENNLEHFAPVDQWVVLVLLASVVIGGEDV